MGENWKQSERSKRLWVWNISCFQGCDSFDRIDWVHDNADVAGMVNVLGKAESHLTE